MELKLTSHFQKLHFQQNLVQLLPRSISRKLLYHTSMSREKNRRCCSICTNDMGLFRGQKTEAVTSLLEKRKILNEYVPNNMTNYFQVLDLTVNKWGKDFMKQKFNKWFATQLRNKLQSRKALENITIKLLLSTMKSLHAGWLIDCYNQLILSHGKEVILTGWRASGISVAVEDGSIDFFVDPFNEIDPFDQIIEINMTSVFRPMSEEYINKEKVSNDYDLDDKFRDLENSDFNKE